jgi:hypothetical protein
MNKTAPSWNPYCQRRSSRDRLVVASGWPTGCARRGDLRHGTRSFEAFSIGLVTVSASRRLVVS